MIGVVELTKVRQTVIDSVATVRKMTTVKGIMLADAIDDSLVYHLGTLLEVYRKANPEPIFNPGSEKFSQGIRELGFVTEWATGFLVHLEMQQIAVLLADFKVNRSEAEIEAAEDSFLRHLDLLAQLYRTQHVELEDLHNSSLANLEWVIGRIESENGTNDFMIATQFFAVLDDGYAYQFKLVSPTTGETMEVYYPLPFMTEMDEGWQKLKKEKETEKKSGS